jgi:peptide/nickel transport system substrate-binding protein
VSDREHIRRELDWAYDFDPNDPLFGLSRSDLRGPKMSRRTVLRLMAAAGMLTLADLLIGCKPKGPEVEGERGGHLKAGWGGTEEISTLDPAQINQVLQFQIASMVLGGLTHINADLTAEGDLAEDWEVSSDGLEWTFKLRKGVTFHNGDKFTADDVVYTYNRSKDPEKSIHSGILTNVTDVQKVDDHTVKLILAKPQASLLVKTTERASGRALTIVNRRALEEMGLEQYGLTPVGTGPFKVVEHQLGQGVVIERFEDYWDPNRPMLNKITYTPIPEPEPYAAAIEAGDLHILGGNAPATQLIDRFLENEDLVVSEVPGPGFQALWMNPWRDPFKVPSFDKPLEELKKEPGFMVRLAIAKAIDRDDFIKRAHFDHAVPAFGSINPAMRFFFDTGINETSEQRFDAAEAQRLLADAGFPNGDGFPTLKLMVTPAGKREGEVLVDVLKTNLNINVELDIKDWTVLVEYSNKMDFDMLRIGSGGDYDPDDGLVDWMQTISKFNGPDRPDDMPFGMFSIKEVDELIEQQRVETDLNKRKELVQKANKLTSDKVAAAFTHHPTSILVYRKEVNYPDVSLIPGLVDLDRATLKQT